MIKKICKLYIVITGMVLFMVVGAVAADITIAVGDQTGREDLGTQVRSVYSLKIMNSAAEGATGVRASIVGAPAGVIVEDGDVSLPVLQANHYAIPDDRFVLVADKGTLNEGQPVSLQWQLEFSDSSGLRQMTVVTVSTL